MKLKFKTQAYQTAAVQATVDCFKGQPPASSEAISYRIDPGKARTDIIEHLAYDPVEDKFDLDIFTSGQTKQDFSKAGGKLQRHIYDYVLTDSKVEQEFVKELDTANEVVVYAKLPRGFLIPAPVGDYNPDWAIAFKEGNVKHIYFVAETKGTMSSMELREIERTKIKCARKFFDEMNRRYAPESVKYDVVDSFGRLMEIVMDEEHSSQHVMPTRLVEVPRRTKPYKHYLPDAVPCCEAEDWLAGLVCDLVIQNGSLSEQDLRMILLTQVDANEYSEALEQWRTQERLERLPLVMNWVRSLLTIPTGQALEIPSGAELSNILGDERTRLLAGRLLQASSHQQQTLDTLVVETVLGAEESSPFRAASLFDETSLHGLAQQQIEQCTEELQQNHQRRDHLEQERLGVLEQQAPLRQQQKALQNRIAQLQAAINGNNTEVERLKKEPEALQEKLPLLCVPGNRLMRDCEYVRERIDVIQLSSIRDTRERQRKNEEYQSELTQQKQFLGELEQKLFPFDTRIASLTSSSDDNKNQEMTILGRKKYLETAIAEYDDYEGIIANPSDWQELAALKNDKETLDNEIGQITLAIHHQQSQYAERKQALRDAADSIARSIPGFTWGNFDCDKTPPFHMGPMHSTTYGVLETLAGDLVCLLDSSHSESSHPGFLLHDSPREAEMSEVLLWSLLKIAKDNAGTACQYVVTTSTEAPPAFEGFVRVRLHSREEDGFLFKKRIGMEARPLDM